MEWLDPKHREPFLIIGPDGCGKSLVLRQCFTQQRSTQVAIIHCSAQTNPSHVLQKLMQTCEQLSSLNGRVFKPKGCENLILYLKDINLPKPDKWGTCQLVTFLQQLITYNGFYDEALEFVKLENIQIIGSMNPITTIGRHKLSSRFTSVVRIFSISYVLSKHVDKWLALYIHNLFFRYPTEEELKLIYSSYLRNILTTQLSKHAKWNSNSNIFLLASSMIRVYMQVSHRL
jgi:dynein heavy chain 2, cytosolic